MKKSPSLVNPGSYGRGHTRSRRDWIAAALVVLWAIFAGRSQGQVTATVDSALAPLKTNANGSPNPAFIQWSAATLQSLSQGGGPVGNFATDPAAYQPTATVGQAEFMGTLTQAGAVFPSWRGVADPPPPFDTQYGTGLAFPLRLVSTTTKFKLSNLDNIASSDDPNNTFSFVSHSAQGRNYAFNQVGIDYGPDGIPGTADDIVYGSGQSGNLPVNELLFTGVGVFVQTYPVGSSDQANIDQSVANFFGQNPITHLTNEYVLHDDSGNVLVDVTRTVTVTPEPTAVSGLGAFAAAVFFRRRRVQTTRT